MATILNIETATSVCSVSIGIKGECVALKEINEGKTHAEFITVFIDEVIKKAGIEYKDLDAIAVSSGPGSYTGLRIGVSTAKGLCYALDKPLIAMSTLEALANGGAKFVRERFAVADHDILNYFDFKFENILLCPMIDARRMEVYTAIYTLDLAVIKPISADIIDETLYNDYLLKNLIYFFGDGSNKFHKIGFKKRNAIIISHNILPSAMNMIPLSENKFLRKEFENLAYFEPFYLKEVNITKAKNTPKE